MNSKTVEYIPPEFEFTARKKCGCLVGVCADMGDRETGAEVAKWIARGLAVERLPRARVVEILKNERFGCHCELESQNLQLKLF
jgi:hypothetical protein